MPKSKVSAFLSLLLVFFSGAVLGAFAYRLYTVKTVETVGIPSGAPPKKGGGPEEFLRQRLAEMKDRVKADDQQLERIKQVYNETREKYDGIRQKMNGEGMPSMRTRWPRSKRFCGLTKSRSMTRYGLSMRPPASATSSSGSSRTKENNPLH